MDAGSGVILWKLIWQEKRGENGGENVGWTGAGKGKHATEDTLDGGEKICNIYHFGWMCILI